MLTSCGFSGIDAFVVEVEVDLMSGQLPSYHVVGLPAASVREGAVRIRSSLEHTGNQLPRKKVTVNLAPADRRKEGAAFDLPIALAVLAAEGVVDPAPLAGFFVMGELGLDGTLRTVRGVLSAALLAVARRMRGIIVPACCAGEAVDVEGIRIVAASHLSEVIAFCRGEFAGAHPAPVARDEVVHRNDMSEIRGQECARMALEVAVAGGHNLLLVGPPGCGKTMLARRIPTILPPLSRDEALETTRIYSSLNLNQGCLMMERPFRAPHHTITTPALIGGGSPPNAGEMSLAHNGVLFLDELTEFQSSTLESMRQPLEDRRVVIGRVSGRIELPASVLLAASANPCPCGWLGTGTKQCVCSLGRIERYRSRLSGPLLDRMDLQIFVPNVKLDELRDSRPSESSAEIRDRVVSARARQAVRLAPFACRTNAAMDSRAARATCNLTPGAEKALRRLHKKGQGMSGRSIDRIIRVARTIADLSLTDFIDDGCIFEAASYRSLDLNPNFENDWNEPAMSSESALSRGDAMINSARVDRSTQ